MAQRDCLFHSPLGDQHTLRGTSFESERGAQCEHIRRHHNTSTISAVCLVWALEARLWSSVTRGARLYPFQVNTVFQCCVREAMWSVCKLNLAEIICGGVQLELKRTSSNGPLSMDIDEDQDGLEEHHCGASRLPHNSDHGPLWHRLQRPLLAEGLSGK